MSLFRALGPEDAAKLEQFLAARVEDAMFPLGNLRRFGIVADGFAGESPYAMRYWQADRGVLAWRGTASCFRCCRLIWHRMRRPVATTGFNAALPEVVQIGAVYVPPAHRGHGHAARAVALHLAQARKAGTRRAVLFSASAVAGRAYLRIGFRATGRMTIVFLNDAVAA